VLSVSPGVAGNATWTLSHGEVESHDVSSPATQEGSRQPDCVC
jgi:hypothetical protein